MTNLEFSKTDVLFKRCCEFVKIQATVRQASKFQRELGKAFLVKRAVAKIMKEVKEAANEEK